MCDPFATRSVLSARCRSMLIDRLISDLIFRSSVYPSRSWTVSASGAVSGGSPEVRQAVRSPGHGGRRPACVTTDRCSGYPLLPSPRPPRTRLRPSRSPRYVWSSYVRSSQIRCRRSRSSVFIPAVVVEGRPSSWFPRGRYLILAISRPDIEPTVAGQPVSSRSKTGPSVYPVFAFQF